MKPAIRAFDSFWNSKVKLIPQSWDSFFFTLTAIGEPVITIMIGVIIITRGLWTHNQRLVWAGAMVPLTILIGSMIKELVRRVRPLNPHPHHRLWLDTYSFPSGHAAGSMIAYGLLAYFALRHLPQPLNYCVAAILAVLPFGIGVSRIYIGVHFPSDVVGGWLLGVIFLAIVIMFIKPTLG